MIRHLHVISKRWWTNSANCIGQPNILWQLECIRWCILKIVLNHWSALAKLIVLFILLYIKHSLYKRSFFLICKGVLFKIILCFFYFSCKCWYIRHFRQFLLILREFELLIMRNWSLLWALYLFFYFRNFKELFLCGRSWCIHILYLTYISTIITKWVVRKT